MHTSEHPAGPPQIEQRLRILLAMYLEEVQIMLLKCGWKSYLGKVFMLFPEQLEKLCCVHPRAPGFLNKEGAPRPAQPYGQRGVGHKEQVLRPSAARGAPAQKITTGATASTKKVSRRAAAAVSVCCSSFDSSIELADEMP
eukprot:1158648-Pelagomonas_calceolata.AAC.7